MTNTTCNCTAKTELEALRAEVNELRGRLNLLRSAILQDDLLNGCHFTLCQVKEEYANIRDEEGDNIITYADEPSGYYFTEAVRRHRLADKAVEDFTLLDHMIRGILDSGVKGEAWG